MLEQGSTQAHYRRALDLVREIVGVHDRAAVEGRDDPRDTDLPVRRSVHLGTGGDTGLLLDAAGDPEPTAGRKLSIVPRRPFGGRSEHVGEPLVLEVAQAELDRVDAEPPAELVEVRLTREVVRGGGERPVRALPKRRVGRLEADPLVPDRVGTAEPGGAGADVQELPGVDRAVARC